MAINTGSSNSIVGELLRKDNHENWRACMKNYLLSQDLWEVVEDETEPPKAEEDEAGYKAWRKKNAAALHAIQISCSPDLLAQIREETGARDAWGTLADLCEPTPIVPPQAQLLTIEPTPIVPAQAQPLTTEPTPIVPGQAQPPATQPDGVGRNVEPVTTPPLALIKAICGGDLDTVRGLLAKHPYLINSNVSRVSRATAFHFAVLGTMEILNEFLDKMSKEELEMPGIYAQTALHMAATHKGKIRIAEGLIQKSNDLLTIPNNRNEIPLVMACLSGNEDMIYYLYSKTSPEFPLSSQDQHQANLALGYCIINNNFELALHLLRRCPQLVVPGTMSNAVLELSYQPSAFLSTSGLSFWQRCIYSCLKVKKPDTSTDDVRIYTREQDQKGTKCFILKEKLLGLWSNVLTFFGIKQIYDLKQKHLYANELLVLISKKIVGLDASQIVANGVHVAIFNAAQRGMTEFIIQIIKANIDLLWVADDKVRNIFQCAVANRQEKTFSLVYGLDSVMRTQFSSYTDTDGNNTLHLAAHLSHNSQLPQISGAALQMQRELQWFNEVESTVLTAMKKHVNNNRKTPHELFNQSHAELKKEGEKWMKDIAQSSIIVGTLIITITFAALYTVPGGNNQETGIPLLLTRKAFKVFVISDAISLFASATSVLMFVGLLTSRYTAKDFLKSLPTKLIIALSSLFISIATMMIAFSSTVIIMLKGQLTIVIPIVLLASIPVSLFIWLQFPLLVKMIISTYGPGIFDRKMKNWLI